VTIPHVGPLSQPPSGTHQQESMAGANVMPVVGVHPDADVGFGQDVLWDYT
jgi:hypothetical protein